jgi:hypothetical protein
VIFLNELRKFVFNDFFEDGWRGSEWMMRPKDCGGYTINCTISNLSSTAILEDRNG